ncbi:MAG: NAD-dependent DNA ligase LigA [Flavobacteriaceae bacterium]|nr:NAD-dependent DNA ligase LigA [Flavobacteriaceae bacterium]
MNNTLEQINALREELHQHNYYYYVLDRPIISDFDFDLKLKKLQALEDLHPEYFDENSPTQRVGGQITKNFETVTHQNRMYSLDNSYSKEDLLEWEKRNIKLLGTDKITYTCELKFDGASINLTYKNNQLERAVTRGDGFQGDNVTQNIKTIKSIPLKLKNSTDYSFEIRGEIILPIDGFNKMNLERIEAGEDPFMNPRNTASGSLKLQDSTEVAKRPLDCLLYQIIGDNLPYKTHFDNLQFAKKMGFKIPDSVKVAENLTEVFQFIDEWDQKRLTLPYETDGVVVKINSIDQQEELGYTAKSPRWAIAYKYKTEQVATRLLSVDYQVGRTGAITPVANLEPVPLGGTIVKRASLHNADQIEKLDLHLNDEVYVEKGGEIIPKIVGVNELSRNNEAQRVQYITHCPECQTALVRTEGDAKHFCPNEYGCPPQITGRIIHFISRKAMNIDGLGAETVELLFKNKLIYDFADLYDLKVAQLIPLERMAEKSAQNIADGLIKSKEIPFEKVLFAIGIRFVGETVSKKLAKHFKSMDYMMSASYDALITVDEIGDRIAQSIVEFSNNIANQQLINRLKSYGLQFEIKEDTSNKTSEKLKNLVFVVSGVFEKVSREELKQSIEQNGGKVGSSISSKTNYVVAGENMGPSKRTKAEDLKIPIISENDFFEMIQE